MTMMVIVIGVTVQEVLEADTRRAPWPNERTLFLFLQ